MNSSDAAKSKKKNRSAAKKKKTNASSERGSSTTDRRDDSDSVKDTDEFFDAITFDDDTDVHDDRTANVTEEPEEIVNVPISPPRVNRYLSHPDDQEEVAALSLSPRDTLSGVMSLD